MTPRLATNHTIEIRHDPLRGWSATARPLDITAYDAELPEALFKIGAAIATVLATHRCRTADSRPHRPIDCNCENFYPCACACHAL